MVKGGFNFPAGFAFGAAVSGSQSEGGLEHSDWQVWERTGKVPPSGRGCDKRSRYEEDFLRLTELGLTHYLMGLEWSRIEPQKGVYNREALEAYRTMMEAAKRRGMTLWVALQHVTLPGWFARMGGFMDEAALQYWHRYVELVAKELGRHADNWVPILNPVFYAAGSYLLGKFPPGKPRMDKFSELLVRIIRAHGDAFWLLKKYLPAKAKVGMSSLVVPVEPLNPESDADRVAAEFIDSYLNQVPLEALREGVVRVPGKGAVEIPSCRRAADFFGINYFFPLLVSKEPHQADLPCLAHLAQMGGMPGLHLLREGQPRTEVGFAAHPEGIYDAIKRVHASGLETPLLITGAGVATRDESYRVEYISRSLAGVQRALDQGLNVGGYFHYSDVDAYEWDLGFDAHYGLCGFDPLSFERTPRPAAEFLAKAARKG